MQGKAVNTFSKSNLKSTGFTGVEVFNEKMEDVFKGTTAKESFLYITITGGQYKKLLHVSITVMTLCFFSANKTVLAENYFFPSNFTDVALPDTKVAAADFKLTPDNNIIMVSLIIKNQFSYIMRS